MADMRVMLKPRSTLDVCTGIVWAPWSIHTKENIVIRQKPTDLGGYLVAGAHTRT